MPLAVAADAWRYVLTVDGREMEFGDGEVTLGRSRTATVRVDHDSVSRTHALLTFERGNGILKDLNSSNGTYVGGRRILNETRLTDGERIQLGAANVGYRVVPPSVSTDRTSMIDGPGLSSRPAPVSVSPPAAQIDSDAEAGAEEVVAPAPVPPSPRPASVVAAGLAPPLEISVDNLFQAVDERARAEGSEDSGVLPEPEEPLPPSRPFAALEASRPRRQAVDPFAALAAAEEATQRPSPPLPRFAARDRRVPRPLADATLSHVPIGPELRGREGGESVAAEPGGLGSRLVAAAVDGVILLALDLLLLSPVFLILFFRGELQSADGGEDWALTAISSLCLALILGADLWYVVGGWAKTGRTPGKALLGLCVVNVGEAPGTGLGVGVAFRRAVALWLSLLPLGVGLLVAAFRKDRRTWHDLLAGTQVVRSK